MKRLLNSFKYALKGFRAGFGEANFKIHILALLGISTLGIALCFSPHEWIAVVICSAMVLSAELFNTAIEKLVDLVHPEHSKKAGIIKDLGAAAVLVTAIAALVVGMIILKPYVF